jgi:hypothetical protein
MNRPLSLIQSRSIRRKYFFDRTIKPKELKHNIAERLHNALDAEAKIWNNEVQKGEKPTFQGGIGSSERK